MALFPATTWGRPAWFRIGRADRVRRAHRPSRRDSHGLELGDFAGKSEVGDELGFGGLALNASPRRLEASCAHVDEIISGALLEAHAVAAVRIGRVLQRETIRAARYHHRSAGDGARGVLDDSSTDDVGRLRDGCDGRKE